MSLEVTINAAQKALATGKDASQNQKELGILQGRNVALVILTASTLVAATATVIALVFALHLAAAIAAGLFTVLFISTFLVGRVKPSEDLLGLIQDLTNKITELTKKVLDFEELNKQPPKEVADAGNQTETDREVELLQSRLEKARKRLGELKKELRDKAARYTLTAEQGKAAEAQAELLREIEKLTKEKTTLIDEIKKLGKELKITKTVLKETEVNLKTTTKNLDDKNNNFETLEGKFNEQKTELETSKTLQKNTNKKLVDKTKEFDDLNNTFKELALTHQKLLENFETIRQEKEALNKFKHLDEVKTKLIETVVAESESVKEEIKRKHTRILESFASLEKNRTVQNNNSISNDTNPEIDVKETLTSIYDLIEDLFKIHLSDPWHEIQGVRDPEQPQLNTLWNAFLVAFKESSMKHISDGKTINETEIITILSVLGSIITNIQKAESTEEEL